MRVFKVTKWHNKISAFEAIRETKHFYIASEADMSGKLVERRVSKVNDYDRLFSSFIDAKNYLIDREQKKRDNFYIKLTNSILSIEHVLRITEDDIELEDNKG